MLWSAQLGLRGIGCDELRERAGSSASGRKGRSEAAVQWNQQGSG